MKSKKPQKPYETAVAEYLQTVSSVKTAGLLVCDTVELLEQILLVLPIRDVLRDQLVNRQFKAVFDGSTMLLARGIPSQREAESTEDVLNYGTDSTRRLLH